MKFIPRLLHFVWVGDDAKRPDECIDSWRRQNPRCEVKVWGNDEYSSIAWSFKDQMKEIWKTGQLCGVADLMRWEILHAHGGVAIDADSFCLQPLPDWLFDCSAFASWQDEIRRPGLISNAHVGARPRDPLIVHLMEMLRAEQDLAYTKKYLGLKRKKRTSWKTTGPAALTAAFRSLAYEDMTILPSHFFIPRKPDGREYGGAGPVLAFQLYGSTRGSGFAYGDSVADIAARWTTPADIESR